VFLTSEAFQALEGGHLSPSDWHRTTALLISYEWDLREGGPEALAGLRLVARLRDAGARLHVLTAVGTEQQVESTYQVTVVPPIPVARSRLGRACQMIRSGIPEPHCLWVQSAVQAGLRVLSSLPASTVIYSRAMPAASNIVAWHLARRTHRPWVAHFSDEWPPVPLLSYRTAWFAPYKVPLFKLWRWRILRDAGALTFTNPRQAKVVLQSAAGRFMSKAFVVTHLPSTSERRNRPQQDNLFHIVHTGNLNPPDHSSAALLQGLRLFLDRTPRARNRVRLTQAGWSNGDFPEWTKRCGLDGVVRLVGRVTQAEVVELIDSASLLVGFDYSRPDSSTLLSKLPDYVGSGRPILVIAAPTSAMGHLFSVDGVGLTAHYDSPEEVADCFRRVFDAWEQRRFTAFLPEATAIESFSDRRVLAELAGAFAVARRATRVIGEDSSRLAVLGEEPSR
jgi:hypothetical protein